MTCVNFLNQSHTVIAYNKKEGLIQPLRRFFIPLYRTFVLSAVFLLGLLRGGISLDAPADRFGVIWIPSVNEISKPYFDFAGFFGLHFRSKKSPENQGFFQLVVRMGGFEPPSFRRRILSPLCMPFHHSRAPRLLYPSKRQQSISLLKYRRYSCAAVFPL